MTKPVLLDLFCRMGGATVGYQRAGFHVIGVDIEDQPGYPGDEFFTQDALRALEVLLKWGQVFTQTRGWVRPALIHASPPCQEGNAATIGSNGHRAHNHPQLVPPTRALLDRIGLPYVIEQPTSSRKGLIRRDLTLCMDMFKGELPPPWVQKHRSFELSGFTVPQPKHLKHTGYVRGHRHGVVRSGPEAPYVAGYGKGGGKATVAEMRHALGIDWMTDHFDLREAIPPAYAEYIGRAFWDHHDAMTRGGGLGAGQVGRP
jgi:hypothetical protein